MIFVSPSRRISSPTFQRSARKLLSRAPSVCCRLGDISFRSFLCLPGCSEARIFHRCQYRHPSKKDEARRAVIFGYSKCEFELTPANKRFADFRRKHTQLEPGPEFNLLDGQRKVFRAFIQSENRNAGTRPRLSAATIFPVTLSISPDTSYNFVFIENY